MRIFTDIEKDLLTRISNGTGLNLFNLIDPYIEGVSFTINTNTNNLTIDFEVQSIQIPGLHNTVQKRLQEIQSILIQVVNIIKLFEDKGYIFTFKNVQQLPASPFTFGRVVTNLPSVSYPFPDPRVSKLFIDLSTTEIFVTPELPKFISDNFLTREELRANRQYKLTRNALIVSIIALFANLGFNVYNKLTSDKAININNSDVYFHGNKHCKMKHQVGKFHPCHTKKEAVEQLNY